MAIEDDRHKLVFQPLNYNSLGENSRLAKPEFAELWDDLKEKLGEPDNVVGYSGSSKAENRFAYEHWLDTFLRGGFGQKWWGKEEGLWHWGILDDREVIKKYVRILVGYCSNSMRKNAKSKERRVEAILALKRKGAIIIDDSDDEPEALKMWKAKRITQLAGKKAQIKVEEKRKEKEAEEEEDSSASETGTNCEGPKEIANGGAVGEEVVLRPRKVTPRVIDSDNEDELAWLGGTRSPTRLTVNCRGDCDDTATDYLAGFRAKVSKSCKKQPPTPSENITRASPARSFIPRKRALKEPVLARKKAKKRSAAPVPRRKKNHSFYEIFGDDNDDHGIGENGKKGEVFKFKNFVPAKADNSTLLNNPFAVDRYDLRAPKKPKHGPEPESGKTFHTKMDGDNSLRLIHEGEGGTLADFIEAVRSRWHLKEESVISEIHLRAGSVYYDIMATKPEKWAEMLVQTHGEVDYEVVVELEGGYDW